MQSNDLSTLPSSDDQAYVLGSDGIYHPAQGVYHRDEEYSEGGFDTLLKMQSDHFWYRGRHRFLLHALRRELNKLPHRPLRGCDLGGGCGGWIRYLQQHDPKMFSELALTDSSLEALTRAEAVVGPNVNRYQADLMRLEWENRWDVAFLLDVLEHIPDDAGALKQIYQALKPGGILFVATPALQFFWSYNDEVVSHQRRYAKDDFRRLAKDVGFEMSAAQYFMFFLSPLLYLARRKRPDLERMTPREILEMQNHTHRIPSAAINWALTSVFCAETPLGHWLPFPWGTSILGVFKKPA